MTVRFIEALGKGLAINPGGVKFCGGWGWPEEVPLVAVSQCGQCCDGFRVVHLPSTPAAFQACCARFAAGFGRSAAALPATLSELRVVDHLTTLQNIIDQAVRFSLLGSVPQRATLRQQLLPGGFVALVLECVQQVLRPRAALV